jgi:uncharacterized protein GlcG (DUF336 family)
MANSSRLPAWTALPFPPSELPQHDIAYYGDSRFVGWGGGIPLWKDGVVAGAVAVSGLSSGEDIELATLALELIGAQKLP